MMAGWFTNVSDGQGRKQCLAACRGQEYSVETSAADYPVPQSFARYDALTHHLTNIITMALYSYESERLKAFIGKKIREG